MQRFKSPGQPNVSCPFTPPSTTLLMSSAISHPAPRSMTQDSAAIPVISARIREVGRALAKLPRPFREHRRENQTCAWRPKV
jgi:hypothetical protein